MRMPRARFISMATRGMAIFLEAVMSVVREAIAQRLLSTVESNPETSMKTKGQVDHAGKRLVTISRFTTPGF
jgi:hypothetical protein